MALNTASRTKNVGKNTISAFLNKTVILLLTFICRRFFIYYIGVEYLGINGLFANVLTLLSMADLGIGTAMNISLYKPIADSDTKKLSALVFYFRKLYRVVAIIVLVVGTALLPFLKYIVNLDVKIPHIYLYYYLFVIKNVVSYLFVHKTSLIRADQKQYLINRIEVIISFVRIALQIIVIVAFRMYLLYLLLEVVSVVAQNIVASVVADREYPFLKDHSELDSESKQTLRSDLFSVSLYKVSWSLLNGTDNIIMSVLVGTVSVGLYANYNTITSSLEMFIVLLFSSLTASVGNLVATSTEEHRYETFKSMQMVSFWLCSISVVCLYYLTQDFIDIWIGKEYELDHLTLIAIVINMFFSTCMRPVWTFREGTGMYRQIRYVMLATAVINIVLSILLGKLLGLAGILFATSLSKMLTYFWYEPNLLFRNYFAEKPKYYYYLFFKNALLLAFGLAICYVPMQYLSSDNIILWILKAIICICVISLLYYFTYRNSSEWKNIAVKVKNLT